MNKLNFKLLSFNYKNVIKNKVLLSVTITFLLMSTFLEIASFFNYYFNSNIYVNNINDLFNKIFFFKKIFDMLMLSVIVIYLTSLCFYIDKKQGKINLELKGGISLFQIYLQRIIIIASIILTIILFLLASQSLLTLTINEYFLETRLKVINFMYFYFLLAIMIFSITFFFIMMFNSKVVLTVVGFISCLIPLSSTLSSLRYNDCINLYRHGSSTTTFQKWNYFNKNLKSDKYFNEFLPNFEKVYKNKGTLDKYQWAYGNYWYVINNLTDDDKKIYGDNFINFIKDMDKLFNDNYQLFNNPDSNGFKLEDSFVYNYRKGYTSYKTLKQNLIYNIINKIIGLSKNDEYYNFLNILKDYSNYFLEYLEKSPLSIAYNFNKSFISISVEDGYFDETFKNYKTSDQYDFYFFLSSIAYDICNWQNNTRVNYEKNIEIDLSPEQSLIDSLKINANSNPFNQLAQLQFGNYFSKNSLYYYNSLSGGVFYNTFESPTIPLEFIYFKSNQQNNQPPRLDDLEEVNVSFTNYYVLYFSYLIIFMVVAGLSYIKYRKVVLRHEVK
ncbi:hypothetical protein SCORR_v1c05230 [Spiroplasma corruscae]|uniref:Uncharacterized protein n=1 Tax=Spiroplasma corruscae TaxID=216934 RepID=A0A222EP52_9MOLU|nr:hypothetical protein [Spiroplasma corruscae]ASP28295.1 hypothetical protein SCORR_v1c05230 [Spiroplasma corruscae]